ncbi:MAG: hypothetical protein EOP86_10635 [Verrucomicrobiaceae bacterium]|nr:MAG: hypothetical protein EOP86_10635 [Verrucomicrobiaceae bacterium]
MAEAAVAHEMELLPATVQGAAAECPVFFTTMALWSGAGEADGEDDDLLGLFCGVSRLEPAPADPEDAPRVTLFLDNLWEFSGEEEETFRRECATTYLHELGHYLGWDEDEVAARGLK